MDIWKYFGITHADHVVCNPTSPERLDECIALLDLAAGAAVWEAACGKGEFLIRLIERYEVSATGIDISPYEIPVARARAAERVPDADLKFIEADAATQPAEPESIDLAICLGASWIWGGHRGTLRELRRITRPGGLVVVGEPYWIHDPDPAYLAASGMTADLCTTADGNLAIAREEGLTPMYLMPSRLEDWDRYEFLQLRAAERYAAAHPDDPDVPELLERVRRERDEYLRWGRDTLGWGIYLFGRPEAEPPDADRQPAGR
ncbi:MAG TPA: class I SAM-dependent methyltransferase [Actinomycetota bacterium]|nr:class I SAM-dependent methyltransferase [Actinomycetota bacterium]